MFAGMPAWLLPFTARMLFPTRTQGRSIAEPLYTVAFGVAELFSERADSADKVHLDLWERYLERIEPT
jgi:Nitrile hydratase beta subunit